MGNYRFRLANIIPNCLLSKLKNTGNIRRSRGQIIPTSMKKNQSPPSSSPSSPTKPFSLTNRPSYYIPTQNRSEDELLPSPLNPIKTKPKIREDNQNQLHSRRKPPLMNSPRLVRLKIQSLSREKQRRERLKKSFAVVKSSSDPQKDFRESMVEMIVENGILDSKELEDLLACYLALNSTECHEMIVEVFKEIWIALTEIIL